ncbi:16460_t:CDS:1, partial [Acaulospora colombiana]
RKSGGALPLIRYLQVHKTHLCPPCLILMQKERRNARPSNQFDDFAHRLILRNLGKDWSPYVSHNS